MKSTKERLESNVFQRTDSTLTTMLATVSIFTGIQFNDTKSI
uniref:Uncharacterized protein n=1 Tax=Anguilla anguilla TaxID=7936 RepID=A0A0E9QYY4_ANGAN